MRPRPNIVEWHKQRVQVTRPARETKTVMRILCRDCGRGVASLLTERRCPQCGSSRIIEHPELDQLGIAHIDCDAFYAAIEKRDKPALAERPVLVGGRHRGVVMACCYVARRYGIHSAMPMFRALELCPNAVVVPPNMEKYGAVGREVRGILLALTPLVEPLSIDEAFLDLSVTAALHRECPARTLVGLARRIEQEIGITISIGLSYNKFLAKIASDLDKPRGFAVIGQADALGFLRDKSVRLLWGVGEALQKRLNRDGISTIGELGKLTEAELVGRYGVIGRRLARFASGQDDRTVTPDQPVNSISAETTFEHDIAAEDELRSRLWPLCERLARRLKKAGLGAESVTLKLKTADFKLRTRNRRLHQPTRLAEVLFEAARPLLVQEARGERFRLIGIGAKDLVEEDAADAPDLFAEDSSRRVNRERAIDEIRDRFGNQALVRGLSAPLKSRFPRKPPRETGE